MEALVDVDARPERIGEIRFESSVTGFEAFKRALSVDATPIVPANCSAF